MIDKPLPDYYIGKELGKLKLDYIYNEAVFLPPKVYELILLIMKNPLK